MPLLLDLRNLTDAHVEEAIPHLGQCRYAAPCIIGTLIPEDKRARFDNEFFPSIGSLCSEGDVEFPDERQRDLANQLQAAFDSGDRETFDRELARVRKELEIR